MNKYTENKEGYIVFEDGGTSPISYGASEKWFPTYDEERKDALDKVKAAEKNKIKISEETDYEEY